MTYHRHDCVDYCNINGFDYNLKKNSQQLLNEINNDMDLLEKNLNPIFNKYEIKKNMYNNNYMNNLDYDTQDQEIKKLIEKANKLVNNHSYNYYGSKTEYNGMNKNKYYNKNNISEIYPRYNNIENGGNYSNYMERNDDSYSYENDNNDDNDNGYIRNISPEKDINKHRIKNIRNINNYNNNKNYLEQKPIIYRQNESNFIKNSYMNEYIGQPQTYKKRHFSNNLVFSSDKISFRKIKYGGNINQSLDVLFNNQK